MYGPRQGVYTFHQFPLRPHSQQLWQWNQVHHSVKWRQSQFKNPDESYKYRCRAEPQNVSQPVSQPSSVSRPSSASHVRPTSKRDPQRSASSVSLSSSRSSSRLPTRPRGREQRHRSSTYNSRNTASAMRNTKQAWTPALRLSASTPQLSLTAQAVNIQLRPVLKSGSPTHDEDSNSLTPPFPYPDPLTISGDPSFEDRLAELAQLECDTIRHEEAIRRYSTPLLTRPSSTKNIRQTAPKLKVQSVQRVSRNVNNKEQRAQSSMLRSHRASLPATVRNTSKVSTRSTRPNPSTSSIGRAESTAISQSKNVVADNVKDSVVNAPANEQQRKTEVPVCSETSLNESQTATSSDEIDTELSCSPPIVYIASLPNYKTKTNNTVKDKSDKDLLSPEEYHPPVINAWSDGNTVKEPDSYDQAMEDDLQVTSDLGLSIDSLHMFDDDNISKDVEGQPDKELGNESQDNSCSVHAVSSVGSMSTPVCELQSETFSTSHVTRKSSAGKRNSFTSTGSSSSRNTKSQKRHIKNGSKPKSSQNK